MPYIAPVTPKGQPCLSAVPDRVDNDTGIKSVRIVVRKDIRVRAGDGIDKCAVICPRSGGSLFVERSGSRDSDGTIPCIDCAYAIETVECIIDQQDSGRPGLAWIALVDYAPGPAWEDGTCWVPGSGEVGGTPVGELGAGGEEVVVVVVKDDAWVAAVVVCGEGQGEAYILCC